MVAICQHVYQTIMVNWSNRVHISWIYILKVSKYRVSA